jgi:hypothetical protein
MIVYLFKRTKMKCFERKDGITVRSTLAIYKLLD